MLQNYLWFCSCQIGPLTLTCVQVRLQGKTPVALLYRNSYYCHRAPGLVTGDPCIRSFHIGFSNVFLYNLVFVREMSLFQVDLAQIHHFLACKQANFHRAVSGKGKHKGTVTCYWIVAIWWSSTICSQVSVWSTYKPRRRVYSEQKLALIFGKTSTCWKSHATRWLIDPISSLFISSECVVKCVVKCDDLHLGVIFLLTRSIKLSSPDIKS